MMIREALRAFALGGALWVSLPTVQAGTPDPATAARFYEDGLDRFQHQDFSGAIVQLKNALQQDSRMLAAKLLLGRALLAEGSLPAAEVVLQEALKQGISPSEVAVPLGQLYLMGGRPRDVVEKVPQDDLPAHVHVEVLVMRGVAQGQLGDYRAAASSFALARDMNPASVRPLIAEVPVLLGQGLLREANERAEKAVELDPKSADAWNMRASVRHGSGQARAALEDYDKALALQPTHLDARVARAALLLDLGRDRESLADLAFIRKNATGEPRAAYLEALIAARRGDFRRAEEGLAEVVRLTDSVPREWAGGREQILMLGALAHYGLGHRDQAKEYLNVLVSRYGRNLGARKLMARIYLDQKDAVRALSMIDPVLKAMPQDAQALYLAGEANMLQRRYVAASDRFQEALREGGAATPALSGLGFAQLGGGLTARAAGTLEASFKQRPGDPAIGFPLATLHLKRGALTEAAGVANQLVEKNTNNPTVLNFAGAVRGTVGDRAGARDAYRKALAIQAGFKPALLNLARLDVQEGRFDSARQTLNQLLSASRNDMEAQLELGMLEMRLSRYVEARQWLEKAGANRPKDVRPALALIDLEVTTGRVSQALDTAKGLAATARNDPKVLEKLGRVQLLAGDRVGARSSFVDLSRLAGFDAEAQIGAGNLLLAAGAPTDAAYGARKALDAEPGNRKAMLLLGMSELARGATADAEEWARKLRSDNPQQIEGAQLSLAIAMAAKRFAEAERIGGEIFGRTQTSDTLLAWVGAQFANGHSSAALSNIDRWLSKHPNDLSVLRVAGEISVKAQRPAEARKYFESILALDPRDASNLNNLAMVLISLKTPGAEKHARRAYELASGSVSILDTLGWVLVQDGKGDEGLRFLRDARLKAPADGTIRYHLIAALVAVGKLEEARSELADSRRSGIDLGDDPAVAALVKKLGA
ncbi:MAG: PEP-CTERM system TPR-repeat protein PrsT [Rhodocyclaceae bacterium]|jgi:putative PEP-CTERM system TPR-repeat lipoprotein|nr:PEP-CTERM system TPR-repeat protein PrsT [Rhodocyclaceae bacterium]